ncbi:MAG: DUF3472 domain-containing protein [Chitinophagaceae bacterium]
MAAFKTPILFFICCFCCAVVYAQVQLPAFTGYATPVEASNEEDESVLFSEKEGLHNWINTRQQLQYFFNVSTGGTLAISLFTKNNITGSKIAISIANKKFIVAVPAGKQFKKVFVGTLTNVQPGFYSINIRALKKAGTNIAAIKSIELSGTATKGLQFNAKTRRNAASVHLKYPLPDTAKVIAFYDELTIPAGADQVHSYFMATGFRRGYFGIQVNSATERRVIFSVWDAGNEAADRNNVAAENRVQLLGKGSGVVAGDFGNEGTGGHSHWVYNWKSGETYKFMVTALPDSAGNATLYTGYFFSPELRKWKLIAAFKAPKDGKYINGLYSFVENFWGVNGQLQRKALFGNQWVRYDDGIWKEITTASFSYDATGKAGNRTDYGGGVENGQFYLWNGGFQPATAKYADVFARTALAQSPVIDLYNNADSIAQAVADQQQIAAAIAAGQLDTSGSIHGMYYKILKDGNGSEVLLSDTVIACYKGALLNGEVFDETKAKPASFPLNRLIQGWQIGLPLCRVGGKIRLIVPSGLAYSIRTRSSKIPPNSILIFDIEVVAVKR